LKEVGGKAGAENLLLIGNRTREREGAASCAHARKISPTKSVPRAWHVHCTSCNAAL